MKKGFTLAELLVVMVIVGLLVTMALPKYKAAMEKGRGVEGLANAAAISDAVNTYYVLKDNSYGTVSSLKNAVLGEGGLASVTVNKNFDEPVISIASNVVTVSLTRSLAENPYTITFTNANGKVTDRTCSGNTTYCQGLGADCSTTPCKF